MTTFAELQTRVERLVIDLPTSVQTEVPFLINEAMRDIQIDHNFKVQEALLSAQQTTASTRALLAVPSNFKEWRGEPYILTNLGVHRKLVPANDRMEVLRLWENDDEGEPEALLIGEPSDELGAASFEVWPLPDGSSDFDNGEYRVYIPYWRFLTALSADGDNNWFTNNGEQYLIEAATARAFALDWDLEKEAVHLQKAQLHKNTLIKRDKLLRVSTTNTLVPHWQGAYGNQVRSR